jgi:hypothetical protein
MISRKESDAESNSRRPKSSNITEIFQHQKEQHRLSKEPSGYQSIKKGAWTDINN